MPKIKDVQSDYRYIRIKVPRADFDTFENAYPDLASLYLTRSFYYALKSRENFDQIFWLGINKNICIPEE